MHGTTLKINEGFPCYYSACKFIAVFMASYYSCMSLLMFTYARHPSRRFNL